MMARAPLGGEDRCDQLTVANADEVGAHVLDPDILSVLVHAALHSHVFQLTSAQSKLMHVRPLWPRLLL